MPEIDDTIVLPTPAAMRDVARWRALGAELAGGGFDAALLLPNSLHAALLASRAGIPERWGYRDRLARPAADARDRAAAGPAPGGVLPAAGQRARLSERAGRAARRACRRTRATRRRALLTDDGWDGRAPLVALAPGAAYGGAKRWPPASFARARRGARRPTASRCVLVGSAADARPAAAESCARAGRRRRALLNLVGRTDLPTLAGVLTQCRTLVTNDSGAMHLAAALGVDVTAVFGPTDDTRDAAARRRARRADASGLVPALHAARVSARSRCMRGIGVDAVLDAARRTL